MSEMKKSGIFQGLLLPIRYKIEIEKLDTDLWHCKYSEWVDYKDKELLEKAFEGTKYLMEQAGIHVVRRKNKLTLNISGTVDQISTMLIGEFMVLSKLGDTTFRDLIILAGLGGRMVSKKAGG